MPTGSAQTWQRLRPGEQYRAARYRESLEADGQSPVMEGRYVLGEPDQIVAELQRYQQQAPVTEVLPGPCRSACVPTICRCGHGSASRGRVRED